MDSGPFVESAGFWTSPTEITIQHAVGGLRDCHLPKDVLLDDGVIDNIVVAHMDTVRTFNCSRDYSCEEACNNILLILR